MARLLKTLLRIAGIAIGVALVVVAGFVIFLTITEYKPAQQSAAESNMKGGSVDPTRRTFTFFSWNIGYAGLGKDMDFFYDGGKKVIPSREGLNRDLAGIKKTVTENDTIDFIFLQELDRESKRTYHTDILAGLAGVMPGYYWAFGKNYDCRYVPVPLWEPMGRVISGLAAFSPFHPDSAEVVSLNTNFSWPKSAAILKRCILALKYKMDNGKKLVVINLHNSAFDDDGGVRKTELNRLQEYILAEYRKGNWVIAGGDWNDNPRGFDPSQVVSSDPVYKIKPPIDESFLPGWEFVYDPLLASNRNVDMPYTRGITHTTTIDFFVISPNIKALTIKTLPMAFEFSDHNPVVMKVELKEISKQ